MGDATFDVYEGESGYYRRLFAAHHANVLAFCARRVGRDDCSDLAAEVFAIAWRRIDAIPRERELAWLYGVAHNVVSHHRRSRSRQMRLTKKIFGQPPPIVSGPAAQVVQRVEYDLVTQAAARLRPKDQEVLRLVVWEELGYGQIADILGCTESTVRQRFHRAKRSLLREFERIGGVVPIPSVAPHAVAQEGGEA
jgi:RNA polymerase sigma-70 factor, ECF subfamily